MDPKEEISQYLKIKENDRDYTEGYNLFCKYSKNVAVQNYLARKMDRAKLFYKLNQLLSLDDVRESKIAKLPSIVRALEPVVTTEANNRLEASAKKRINPEDLPAELKPLYDSVAEKYKQMRSVHEKIKLAKKAKDREALRKTLLKLDDEIKAGWEIIDRYFATGELPIVEEKKEVISVQSVGAARKYLSTNLPKLDTLEPEDKKNELLIKIKERYELLVKAENNFDEVTLSILEKHGIIESREASN